MYADGTDRQTDGRTDAIVILCFLLDAATVKYIQTSLSTSSLQAVVMANVSINVGGCHGDDGVTVAVAK